MKLDMEPVYALDVHPSLDKQFVVIGAGGTGGYLIPNLAREISIFNRIQGRRHTLTIIDADTIEDRNLLRQNFVEQDVGKNKAQVMAERYSHAFGIDINYIPEYITSAEALSRIIGQHDSLPVLIGCVDNNKTRKFVHEVHKNRVGFSLDCGNEEWVGQIVLGFSINSSRFNQSRASDFVLPDIVDMYPEVGEGADKLPTELSCAEHAEHAPQNILTNQTAANLAMGLLNPIVSGSSEGLTTHAITFNAKNMTFRTFFNKRTELEKYLVKERA